MKPLPDQYCDEVWELLKALTPGERAVVETLAGKLVGLSYEYDLNSITDYDAAIHQGVRTPFEHPDDWLSLSDFTTMIFETGVDLSQPNEL